MYKHYSFDLWSTLIKSNPQFKLERAKHFHAHFNRDKKSLEEVQAVITEIDKMADYSNQLVGSNIDGLEMYAMVLFRLGYPMTDLSVRDILSIYLQLDNLFTKYHPEPYSTDTIPTLRRLVDSGKTLSILSNTAFIKGVSLRRYLESAGISSLFKFQMYSDEIGASKPDEELFSQMVRTVHQYRISNPVNANEIIHIGDNEYADIRGAKKVGIGSFLINSNDKTIKDIP